MHCDMLVSPYFPTGFLEGVFDGILYISPHIFPTGFLEETYRDDDDQDVDDDVTRIIEAEIRESVWIN